MAGIFMREKQFLGQALWKIIKQTFYGICFRLGLKSKP